jgi:prepilin-type N-terminal cleavage/methylation domain-containing protein
VTLFEASKSHEGFSLVELLTVIAIIGIFVTVGTLVLTSTNANAIMNGGVSQIARSLDDAYSMAQAEKVKVTVRFYSRDDEYVDKKNKYEVLKGDSEEPVKPPIGISATKVGGSYYYRLSDSGKNLTIVSPVTVVFKPSGSTTKSVDVNGVPETVSKTITLSYPNLPDKAIVVNPEGEISY